MNEESNNENSINVCNRITTKAMDGREIWRRTARYKEVHARIHLDSSRAKLFTIIYRKEFSVIAQESSNLDPQKSDCYSFNSR